LDGVIIGEKIVAGEEVLVGAGVGLGNKLFLELDK
jgi:serine acetyltransferase